MKKLKNAELNRINIEQFKNAQKIPVIVVLDNIRSSNNVGSVFRTSDAFLIEALYLCGYTATPPDKEIHKTALDAELSVDWNYFAETEEAVASLKQNGYKVFAIEQVERSILLSDYLPSASDKIAIIFGNEVKGVQQSVVDLCDGSIEIPQFGTKHSLNISVSAGIVIWEMYQKFSAINS